MNIKRTCAAVAVTAFGLALGTGAAFAGDAIPCGTPAVPAVVRTVVVPAVPAVTHTEYRWSLETEHVEHLWQKTTTTDIFQWRLWVPNTQTPAVEWSVESPTGEWVKTGESREVVDSPAIPPSSTQIYKWVELGGNDFQWLREGVEPAPDGKRWQKSNDTDTVVTPGVPAVTHTEYQWVEVLPKGHYEYEESATSPGAGWEQGELVDTDSATEDRWSETKPEGEGWVETPETRKAPSTFEYQWSVEAPGVRWVKTDESKTVVDQPAVPETTKKEIVSPAVPAGEPCPVVPVDPADPVDKPEEAPVATPAKPANPAPKPASATPQVAQVAQVQTAAPVALAHTGSDLTLLWTGAALLLAGAGVTAGYRKAYGQN